ncbi:cytidine deaminase [Actinoplanes bogorensis]|uniref:Cytidine deaminase n=1 Tax=Paractinoplanes bogorensis TaxID=1610840 RepID=A0ABS5Z4F5_9ACTN|nr:cytidine deaminase [Actinoplanes bogorensis]MBU2670569.1 cytidine deaminase [Actinoplanes bogorensis]
MDLDQRLVDAAVDQMNRRWPAEEYGGAAALYLEDGQILTSVCLDNINAGVTLCHETGAICQAYTLDKRVTASVCVGREAGTAEIFVLAPCGICQERLALWGPGVQAAVADPGGWRARTLLELNPYYWATRFGDGENWPSTTAHTS